MSRRIFPFAPWELTNNKLDAIMSNIAMDKANSIEKRECLIGSNGKGIYQNVLLMEVEVLLLSNLIPDHKEGW